MPYKDINKRKKYKNEYYQAHKEEIKEYNKEYNSNHREKINAQHREYYHKHQEEIDSQHKEYYHNHEKEIRKYERIYRLKKHYELNITEFDNLLLAQDNKCLICGQPLYLQNPHSVHIDHSHKTGVIRGILCSNCNRAIGFLKDNPEYAYNASIYLESD